MKKSKKETKKIVDVDSLIYSKSYKTKKKKSISRKKVTNRGYESKILSKNFTYFLSKKNYNINNNNNNNKNDKSDDNDQNYISAIRFCKYNLKSIVITIYYPYQSIIFIRDKQFKNWDTRFIFEFDEDHEKEFHKLDDPYDWHIHMKINNNDISKYLKYIFNKYNFNNQTQDTINNLINTNDAHHEIKINKYKNIQIEGSDSNSLKNALKQVKVNQDVYYDILKYDRLYYSIPIYNMSNYVIRICELNLKINTPILNCLKSIYDDFLPFYKQNLSKINFKKIVIIKNKNHTLNKFNNINSNLFFIKLCIIYILFLSQKNNSIESNLLKSKIIVDFKRKEWKLNLIKNLTNRSINLESYQSNNKNINAVVNLNNINLHMAMICYILNVLYFKKKYNYRFSLFDYLNTRINLEYAWNIFQYFKYQELNDNTRKKIIYNNLKRLILLKNKNHKTSNYKKILNNYINLCQRKIKLNSNNNIIIKCKISNSFSPLN